MKLKKIFGGLSVIAVSLGLFASTCFAATDQTATTTATILVSPGARTIDTSSSSITLPSVPLNGTQATTSAPLNTMNIVDASGSGDGWHVQATASTVTNGGQTLQPGSLEINPVQTVSKQDPTSSSLPSVTTSAPQAVDQGAVTLLSAQPGDGMGSYTAQLSNVQLTLPASTYAGTYTATITYSLVTAP